MPHALALKYGLTEAELLDALAKRFRARVALEGVVAEVHLGRKIELLRQSGAVERFDSTDEDGKPDYKIWLPGRDSPVLVECKNVRNSNEAYRSAGKIVGYKVEVQKTRASHSDPLSRFYDFSGYFDILAVCLGKKTGNWDQFMYCSCKDLNPHLRHPAKLAVMQRVPTAG